MKAPRVRNILVPLDFSKLSTRAIDVAQRLARRFDATVHLAHVRPLPYRGDWLLLPSPFPVLDQLDSKPQLIAELRNVATEWGVASSHCHLRDGAPPFHEICRLANELPADLIVTSTHGYRGVKHALLGSTTERLVQHAPCPVLVARYRFRTLNTLLVPVDFSDASLVATEFAIELARKVAAQLILLHVTEPSHASEQVDIAVNGRLAWSIAALRRAENGMREFVRHTKFEAVKYETHVVVGTPATTICAFAARAKPGLIVMATHGLTGLAHLLIGSVAERVVRNASESVLVLPTHPKARIAALRRSAGVFARSKIQNEIVRRPFARKYRFSAPPPKLERRQTNKFRETHRR